MTDPTGNALLARIKALETENAGLRAAAEPIADRLVDWVYLHATEGQQWPSTKTKSMLITRAMQGEPTQDHADSMKAVAPVVTPPQSQAGIRGAFEAGFAAYWGPQNSKDVDRFLVDQNAAWEEYATALAQTSGEKGDPSVMRPDGGSQ